MRIASLKITVNGTESQVEEGAQVADLMDRLGLTGQRVAVEVNAELVPRSTFADHTLHPGDRVEIIHAVGGG
jgi:sulfur carrier protein